MIEKFLYDAVVAENQALKREIEELRRRLVVQESCLIDYDSPILPSFDNIYKSDPD